MPETSNFFLPITQRRLLMERNARFWVFINDSPVKLTLRPGQTLRWCHSSPTEEGWSAEGYTYHHEGDRVTLEHVTDGRDCDGRLRQIYVDFVSLDDLAAGNVFEGIAYPKWESVEGSVYDEYAQAANY